MQVDITGYTDAIQVARLYADLPDRVVKKGMRQALRKAATPALRASQANLRGIRREMKRTDRVKAVFHKAQATSIKAFEFKRRAKAVEYLSRPISFAPGEQHIKNFSDIQNLKKAKAAFLRSHTALQKKRTAMQSRKKFDTHAWTGRLLRSGHIEAAKPRNRKMFGSVVIFSARSLRGKFKAPYAFFLEEGHGIGKRSSGVHQIQRLKSAAKKTGDTRTYDAMKAQAQRADTRRQVKGIHFMRRGFQSSLAQCRAIIAQGFRDNMAREAALHRRAG